MIAELRVRDLAIIADVPLQLGPGLNVLTGETGAGKSMLVDALGPAARRPRRQRRRCGPAPAGRVVEGAFEPRARTLAPPLEALGLEVGGRPAGHQARGQRRGALPRLGQRQPHHHRCRWPSWASAGGPARPARDRSRCCRPTPSGTSSTPLPAPRRSGARSRRGIATLTALSEEEREPRRAAGRGAAAGRLPRHVVTEIDRGASSGRRRGRAARDRGPAAAATPGSSASRRASGWPSCSTARRRARCRALRDADRASRRSSGSIPRSPAWRETARRRVRQPRRAGPRWRATTPTPSPQDPARLAAVERRRDLLSG